jgi:ligand-binding SRPBCC domain-containing protein
MSFKHTYLVNNHISKVWEFYTDIDDPKIVTPKKINLKIINDTTSQKLTQGTEMWIEQNDF